MRAIFCFLTLDSDLVHVFFKNVFSESTIRDNRAVGRVLSAFERELASLPRHQNTNSPTLRRVASSATVGLPSATNRRSRLYIKTYDFERFVFYS